MDTEKLETHWTIEMSIGELLAKHDSNALLFIDVEQVKWATNTEGLAPIMDAKEFFWYATGQWWPKGLRNYHATVRICYPRSVIRFDKSTDPNNHEAILDGVRYLLKVQEAGVCERDLLEQGYMPTNLYRACDQVYAKAVNPT